MMPLIFPEVVMNIRTTDVTWDPTLMRVEYLDDAGVPYYCSFNTRAQPSAPGVVECCGSRANHSRTEDAEAQAGGSVVVIIAVFIETATKGKSRGPPAGSGQSDVKSTPTRTYHSEAQ
jgi:hypothetical protein